MARCRIRHAMLALAGSGLGQPLLAQAMNYAGLQAMLGEPVTTSVTGKPQRVSEVPASMTIITREEIARSPARTVPDLLMSFAGVAVNRWTAGQSDVAVRGGVQTYNARLLVLVNGRQVYLDHYGMTDWNLLGVPLEAIQQIELVRGPASALFGFNAAAGVVNIITDDLDGGRHGSLTIEGGNHGQRRASGVLALPIGNDVGVQLSASHSQEDERAIPDTLFQPAGVKGVEADDVQARITAEPVSGTTLNLSGGEAFNRQLEFLPSQVLSEQRFRSGNVGLTLDHDTGWGSLSGRAYTNWLSAHYGPIASPIVDAPVQDAASLHNRITVVQTSALVRLGGQDTLRLGLEYRDNQLHSDSFFSQRVGYRNAALSTMTDIRVTDRLAVSLAGRIDRLWLDEGGVVAQPTVDRVSDFSRTIVQPSFNAGLVYRVGPAGQIRINGGRGLQSPSIADFGSRVAVVGIQAPVPVLVAGNPRLNPVASWSGELGYDQRVGPWQFGGSVFYTHTAGVIASPATNASFDLVTVTAPVIVARFANIGSFDTHGVELSASGPVVDHVTWRGSYSWTHTVEDLRNGGPLLFYAFAPKATTPEHVADMTVDWAWAGWSLAVDAHYRSGTRQFAFGRDFALALMPVHAAVDLDAKVERTLGRGLTLFAAGDNLGNAAGAYGSPVRGDRRIRAGARLSF